MGPVVLACAKSLFAQARVALKTIFNLLLCGYLLRVFFWVGLIANSKSKNLNFQIRNSSPEKSSQSTFKTFEPSVPRPTVNQHDRYKNVLLVDDLVFPIGHDCVFDLKKERLRNWQCINFRKKFNFVVVVLTPIAVDLIHQRQVQFAKLQFVSKHIQNTNARASTVSNFGS